MSLFFTINGPRSRLFTVRNPISSNLSCFKRKFHRQHDPFRYTRIHPSRQSQLKFQTTSQVLWSYFKAPTNLLFVTTNLLGLGIITTYRGLHTLANTDITQLKDNIPPVLPESNGIDWTGHSNNITKWKEIMEDRATYTGSQKESDEELFPITEDDLLELGPEKVQDLPKDRVCLLIKNQLEELSLIYREVKTILRKLKCYDEAHELAYEKMCQYTGTKIIKNASYEHHLQNKSLYDHYRTLTSPRNKLFSKVNERVSYDFMQKHAYVKKETITKQQFEQKFNKIIDTYKPFNKLQDRFLSRMANLFAEYNDPDYLAIFRKLNAHTQPNENYRVFLNVLSLSLLRQSSTLINSEKLFYEMMKNAIISRNKLIFEKCLLNLNLASKDLKNMHTTKRATKLIRKITKGNQLLEYSYSLNTSIYALKGLVAFKYSTPTIEKATKKILASLKTLDDGEIRMSFALPNSKRSSLKNKNYPKEFNPTKFQDIPIKVIDLVSKIASKSKDNYILTWCILAVSRSSLTKEQKIDRLNNFEQICDQKDLKLLLQQLVKNTA